MLPWTFRADSAGLERERNAAAGGYGAAVAASGRRSTRPPPVAMRGRTMPGKQSLPATIRRSPAKAQRTYEEVLENAEQQYGDGERAHRTAFAALKHTFEKVGDHWEPKERRGP